MPTIEMFGHVDDVELTHAPADAGFVEVRFGSGATMCVQPDHIGGVHRVGDLETAVNAGRALSDDRLRDLQVMVLSALAAAGAHGMTDDEHENVNGLRADSAGKRRLELCRLGMVTSTTDRRPTRRGAFAAVWRITKTGEQALVRARAQVTAS